VGAVRKDGWAKSYSEKVIARFEYDIFPWIGKVPVAELTAPQLLEVIRRIEARGVVETALKTSACTASCSRSSCSLRIRHGEPTMRTASRAARTAPAA
jgi:integrase